MYKFIYLTVLTILLSGCVKESTKDTGDDFSLLSKYQVTCDEAISNNSYDKACDNYMRIAKSYYSNVEITNTRNKYSEYDQNYRQSPTNNEVPEELKQLKQHQIACDKAISNNSYDKACDNYMRIAKSYYSNVEITNTRNKYSEYDQSYRQKNTNEKNYSPKQLASLNDKELCVLFRNGVDGNILTSGSKYNKTIKSELTKRGFTNQHISKARKGTVQIAMPVCMLYAARGLPDNENKTVNRYADRVQHIYRLNNNYFYSENGIIKSWQTHE